MWTSKENFPSPRADVASFVIGTIGYVYTGEFKDNFFAFDPALNTWTSRASFTGGSLTGPIGFSVNGRGYVGTGYGTEYRKDIFEYWP